MACRARRGGLRRALGWWLTMLNVASRPESFRPRGRSLGRTILVRSLFWERKISSSSSNSTHRSISIGAVWVRPVFGDFAVKRGEVKEDVIAKVLGFDEAKVFFFAKEFDHPQVTTLNRKRFLAARFVFGKTVDCRFGWWRSFWPRWAFWPRAVEFGGRFRDGIGHVRLAGGFVLKQARLQMGQGSGQFTSAAIGTSGVPIQFATLLAVARRISRGHISWSLEKTASVVAGTVCQTPASTSDCN